MGNIWNSRYTPLQCYQLEFFNTYKRGLTFHKIKKKTLLKYNSIHFEQLVHYQEYRCSIECHHQHQSSFRIFPPTRCRWQGLITFVLPIIIICSSMHKKIILWYNFKTRFGLYILFSIVAQTYTNNIFCWIIFNYTLTERNISGDFVVF